MYPKTVVVVVYTFGFVWSIVDLVITTWLLTLVPGSSWWPWKFHWSIWRLQLQFAFATPGDFDFRQTYVDLWIMAVVRSAMTIGACVGALCSFRRQALVLSERLRTANQLVTVVCTLFLTWAPIKLLAYDEFNPLLNDVSFWVNSAWNVVASVVTLVLWHRPMQKSVKHYIEANESTSNEVNEISSEPTAGLLQNEETQNPDGQVTVVNPNAAKKKKDDDKDKDENEDELFDGPDKTPSIRLLARLLGYAKEEWLWYVGGFGAIILYSGSNILIPYYTGQTISNIVISHSYTQLMHSVFMVFLLSMGSTIFGGVRGGCFSYVIAKVVRKIRYDLFTSVVRQDIGFFDRVKAGNINSRITSDCETMSSTIGLNINVFARSTVMMIGSIVVMFSLSWQLTIVTLVVTPIVTLISQVYGEFFDKLQKRFQDTLAKSNEVADEVISSMRTVRSFANEKHEIVRYKVHLDNLLKVKSYQCLAYVGYIWCNEFFYLLTLIGTLWYGGHLVISGRMASNDLVSFLLYQLQLGDNLQSIGYVWTGMMQSVGASRKVFRLITREPDFDVNQGDYKPSQVAGRIEFRDVCFAYPTRPDVQVLNELSFVVSPGEMVALVGPSGGGKSSCISLIQHFYRPTSGQVLLDGRPVQQYEHQNLHKIVSLVSQEPVLYARSVADNIAYGLDDDPPTREEIELTAKQANAHEFIIDQPQGYETEVGEKGQQLSGGQKQRVAIARSLIRRPKILLLDEATSALDSESEHLVQEAIYRNVEGHTVLLIAHRLSTVEKADRIVVIEKGRVVQQGKHSQLLAQDGLYRNLVSRQLLGAELPSTSSEANLGSTQPSHPIRSTTVAADSPTKRQSSRGVTETEFGVHHVGSPIARSLSKSP